MRSDRTALVKNNDSLDRGSVSSTPSTTGPDNFVVFSAIYQSAANRIGRELEIACLRAEQSGENALHQWDSEALSLEGS
jgi:hypothetical protein